MTTQLGNALSSFFQRVANATAANQLGESLFGGSGAALLGLAAALLVLAASTLLTWLVLRITWVAMGAAPRRRKEIEEEEETTLTNKQSTAFLNEGFILVDARVFVVEAATTAVAYVGAVLQSLLDALYTLYKDFFLLLGLVVLAIAATIWLFWHEFILQLFFEIWQCTVRPVLLDGLVFPLLNLARVLFALIWPFVNAARDITTALTTGNLKVILACTTWDVIGAVLATLADASRLAVTSFVDFIQYGLLFKGRWELYPALVVAQSAVNETQPVAQCYCADLDPVWNYTYALTQIPTIPIAIDCGVNAVVRWIQIPLNAIFRFELPNTTQWADEVMCTIDATGVTAQDVGILTVEFFENVYRVIADLVSSLSVEARAPLYARVAALHAMSENVIIIPPALAQLRATPGAVPLRSLTLATFSAIDDGIASAHGKADKIFAFDTVEPDTEYARSASSGFHASQINANNFWWDTLSSVDLLLTLGFDALLRVANTQWAAFFTAVPKTIVGVFNITVNAVFHPVQAFATVTGISFWQFGFLGDYTRAAVNAFVELLAFFDTALPCAFSKPAQALASTPESGAELLFGALYSWSYPPWQVGVPPPVNCSNVTCATPAPSGWSPLDVLPAYYAWNTSRMRRNLDLLIEGGDCTAYLLGCNTSAENNPYSNITGVSNCTNAPLGCTARSFNRVVVEILNNTLAFIFYLPDLVQFKPGKKTFDDLPFNTTLLALNDFIFCLGLLLDQLDVFNSTGGLDLQNPDHCIVSIPPPPLPGTPNISLPGPGDPNNLIIAIPQRSQYECRLDNKAYYLDDRFVMVTNASNPLNLSLYHYDCDIRSTRGCAIAQTPNVSVQVLGSAPEDNVTLIINPPWVPLLSSIPFIATFNATDGTLLNPLPNATSNPGYANFSIYNVTLEDCTFTDTRLPDALGVQYACSSEAYTMYIEAISQLSVNRSNGYVNIAAPPVPTPTPEPSTASPAGPTPTPTPTSFLPPPPALACAFAKQPQLVCDFQLNNFVNLRTFIDTPFGRREVFAQLTTYNPVVNYQIPCITPVSVPTSNFTFPNNVICYRNQLFYSTNPPAYPPPVTLLINDTMLFPLQYYTDLMVTTSGAPVGCENVPPDNYTCSGAPNTTGSMVVTDDLALVATLPSQQVGLDCTVNPATLPPPTCTRLTINYTDGSSIITELEGGEIRVFANNSHTRLPLTCQAASSTAGVAGASVETFTNATSYENAVLSIQNADALYDVRAMITLARARAQVQYAKRDGSLRVPIATSSGIQALRVLASTDSADLSFKAAAAYQIDRLLEIASSPAYRKESVICCLSEVVTLTLHFFVSTFYQIVFLIQSTLTSYVYVSRPINIPTFAEARDDLREALCRLGCALSSLIPASVSCLNSAGGSCGNVAVCGRNFLCDLFDIPILVVDFIVDVLTLIKGLVDKNPNTPATIFGPYCSGLTADAGGCLVSFLVYVVSSSTSKFTQLLRSGAGVLDCLFCVLINLGAPTRVTCPGILYAILNPLANLIDGIISTFLKAVLTFIVGIIKMIIYFFSGQLSLLISTFFNEVLKSVFLFIGNIASAIWQFLISLPGVGKVFEVIFNVVKGACDVLNNVIKTFGGSDIGCSNLKRSTAETGWITPWDNVSAVWSGAASAACGARMAALNATDFFSVMNNMDVTYEVMYCHLAHLWVGPDATPEAGTSATSCDALMPALYTQGYKWADINPITTRPQVIQCIQSRFDAEQVRSSGDYATSSWFPHDFFYSPLRAFQLADELWMSFDVYAQYSSDRTAGAAQLISQSYRASWSAAGYDVSHLASFDGQVGLTAATVYNALDSNTGLFSLQSYVNRSVVTLQQVGARGQLRRTYDPNRIGALAAQLWVPFFATEETRNVTLGSVISSRVMDLLETYADQTTLAFPMTQNTVTRLMSTDDSRELAQSISGLVRVWTQDIPSMLIRIWRAPARAMAANEAAAKKRALEEPNELPAPSFGLSLWYALQGALSLAQTYVGGPIGSSREWLTTQQTLNWLHEQQDLGATAAYLGASTANDWRSQSFFSSAVSSIVGRLYGLLPFGNTPVHRWQGLFALGQSENISSVMRITVSSLTQATGVPTTASMRNVKLSRVGAGMLLAGSVDLRDPYHRDYVHLTEVNNQTNLTCLFGIPGNLPPPPDPNATSSPSPTPTPTPTPSAPNCTDPPPLTYPLCQKCPGGDWILGRTMRAVLNTLYFFGVEPSDCPCNSTSSKCVPGSYPSLAYTFAQFNATNAYLNNTNAVVIVGNSPSNPVVYPYRLGDNWAYWEDPTPHKIGFSDFTALWNATWCYFSKSFTVTQSSSGDTLIMASTLAAQQQGENVVMRFSPKSDPNAYGPIRTQTNAIFSRAVDAVLYAVLSPSQSGDTSATMSAATANPNATCSTQFTSLSEVAQAWFEYFWNWRSCGVGELDGSRKRFSLAALFIVYVPVLLLVSLMLAAILPGSFLTSFIVSTFAVGLFLIVFFLVLAYDYSFGCVPALPLGLADDVMYALLYSFLAKCLVGASVVNELAYDNTTCFACSAWQAGQWTIPNFAEPNTKFSFIDLRYNLAFLLRAIWPDFYDQLRPGSSLLNIPFLGALLSKDFFQKPLAQYANFSTETVTDREFAQYWQGGTWITAIANIIIASIVLILFIKLLWPVALQAFNLLYSIFLLLFPLLFLILTGTYVVSSFGAQYANEVVKQEKKQRPLKQKMKEQNEENQDDTAIEMQSAEAWQRADAARRRLMLETMSIDRAVPKTLGH